MNRSFTFRSFIGAVLLAVLTVTAACSREPQTDSHGAQFFIFGTVLDVTIRSTDREEADRLFSELHADFQRMHREWHTWDPGPLTRINEALAEGRSAQATPDILTLVRRSVEIETASGGRFNAAIGGLIRLWGFHTSDYPILGPPPQRQDIEALLEARPSTRDLRIDGDALQSDNPAVQLDFGGIAKGYAIDLALDRLSGEGIAHAIVNAGGDLAAMGDHGDRPWRVAIRRPGGGIVGTLETHGREAVFTSGVYERFREDERERYPHILDPRTGWPVSDVAAVTVVASEGLFADAAATALIVAGPDEWRSVAQALGLHEILLIDAAGKLWLTPAMAERVLLETGVEWEVVALERP